MIFKNINLSELEFATISDVLSFQQALAFNTDKSLVFVRIRDLSKENRMILRRAINQNDSSEIILLSINDAIAKFAWRINAFHFLSYPIDPVQLKTLRSKLKYFFVARKDADKIRLNFKGGFDMIHPSDISVIQGQGNYCQFFLRKDVPKLYTVRIGEMDQLLNGHSNIVRINKSLLINVNHLYKVKDGEVYFYGKPKVILKLSKKAIAIVKRKLLWLN